MDWSPKETAQSFEDWCIDTNTAPGDKGFVSSLTVALENFRREQLKLAGVPEEPSGSVSDEDAMAIMDVFFGRKTSHQVRAERGLPTLN